MPYIFLAAIIVVNPPPKKKRNNAVLMCGCASTNYPQAGHTVLDMFRCDYVARVPCVGFILCAVVVVRDAA